MRVRVLAMPAGDAMQDRLAFTVLGCDMVTGPATLTGVPRRHDNQAHAVLDGVVLQLAAQLAPSLPEYRPLQAGCRAFAW